jgi:hypothetical protein
MFLFSYTPAGVYFTNINKRICANILAPIKSLTFMASTKKLCAKLSFEKAARKMLVKLIPDWRIEYMARVKTHGYL